MKNLDSEQVLTLNGGSLPLSLANNVDRKELDLTPLMEAISPSQTNINKFMC